MKTTRKSGLSPQVLWSKKAERALQGVIRKAHLVPKLRKKAPAPKWVVEIEIVGRAAMRKLNREARGKDRPTDVLSFELPEGFRRQGLIGQLVICLPVLKSQARELGHAESTELRVLIVHGLLHLLGFDHEKGPAAAREMARLEDRILGSGRKGRATSHSSPASPASPGLIRRVHSCIN
ncbi:MAG: rRNA maturation RNase YbeY [Oligoflexia bacterium]|nr:rRNA maturation RNase YbeY [Oligoflexia bacterium]